MQYILDEKEFEELQQCKVNYDRISGYNDKLIERLEQHQERIKSLQEANQKLYGRASDTVNIGTYPIEIANIITKELSRMKKNKHISGTKPIKMVRRKGRGKRRIDGRNYDSGLPISKSEKIAIYVDMF